MTMYNHPHHTGEGLPLFKEYLLHYGARLGNVLAGIMRAAVPIVRPVVKHLGKSLIRAGANKLESH